MQQQPTSHRRVLFKDTLPFCRYFTFFTLVNFETSSSSHTYVPEPFFTLPSHYPRVLDPLRCSQYLTVQADSSRHACPALNVSFADASQSHPHTPAYSRILPHTFRRCSDKKPTPNMVGVVAFAVCFLSG